MSDSNFWRPSRSAGLQQLETFCPRAGEAYARNRNFDAGEGNHDAVSRLSPWLRHRAITEQEVIRAALESQGEKAAQKFIQETIWRTYWKGWLQHRPGLWNHYLQSVIRQREALSADTEKHAALQRALTGTTDIDILNSWVRELTATGYLHNHARMWFASIWVFTLRLPWQLGADFFIRHLLDGDPASNTLSWRWVAGLHTNGKAYLATSDNIKKFAPDRAARYPRGLDSLAAEAIVPTSSSTWPTEAQALQLDPHVNAHEELAKLIGSPAPDDRWGFLAHEDDCGYGFEQVVRKARSVASLKPQRRSDRPNSDDATAFTLALVNEAGMNHLKRSQASASVEASTAQTIGSLAAWAESENLTKIYTPFAPVGPAATALEELSGELSKKGVSLIRLLRPYDAMVWPHASKGFFKLNKRIPEIISALTTLDKNIVD